MITKIIPPVIWFEYKGDEVCWNGEGYTSLTCGGTFQSLEDMDNFWYSYYKDTYGFSWETKGFVPKEP